MGWWWALIVAGLLLGSAAFLARLAWGLVRQGLALGRELAQAGTRMGEIATATQAIPGTARAEPSVFDSPARLRGERQARLRRARRARLRAHKRARAQR